MLLRSSVRYGIAIVLLMSGVQAFQGPRVGLDMGYKYTVVRHTGKFVPSAALAGVGYTVESRQVTPKNSGFLSGAHIGYDWTSEAGWYKSLELALHAEFGRNKGNIRFLNQNLLSRNTLSISQKITNEYSATAHFGKAVSCDVFYGIAEIKLARFKEAVFASGRDANLMNLPTIHKHRFGGGAGFGYRHGFAIKHSVGVEATYSIYSKTRIKDDVLAVSGYLQSADLHVGSKTPHVGRLTFKYSYSF